MWAYFDRTSGSHYVSDSIGVPVTNPITVQIVLTLLFMNPSWGCGHHCQNLCKNGFNIIDQTETEFHQSEVELILPESGPFLLMPNPISLIFIVDIILGEGVVLALTTRAVSCGQACSPIGLPHNCYAHF